MKNKIFQDVFYQTGGQARAAHRDGLQGAKRSHNTSCCEHLQRGSPPDLQMCAVFGLIKGVLKARRPIVAALMLAAMVGAQAHTGHGTKGFTTGLLHPFYGLDHLLAMLVVGIWSAAAFFGKGLRQLIGPAVFMSFLLIGGALPLIGVVPPMLESGVALSVVALGVLMLANKYISSASGLVLIGIAALMHGMAHGSELDPAHSFASYAAGFLLGSALLHATGLALGQWLRTQRAWLWSAAATLVGVSGAVMFVARI